MRSKQNAEKTKTSSGLPLEIGDGHHDPPFRRGRHVPVRRPAVGVVGVTRQEVRRAVGLDRALGPVDGLDDDVDPCAAPETATSATALSEAEGHRGPRRRRRWRSPSPRPRRARPALRGVGGVGEAQGKGPRGRVRREEARARASACQNCPSPSMVLRKVEMGRGARRFWLFPRPPRPPPGSPSSSASHLLENLPSALGVSSPSVAAAHA